ncbi:protein of unknown function (plasmid) [Cupriavidus taiwanensis]|uniref:Integrase catalytic domain-containing protein n=1 Tax=Cupriavidus taiwanensis TaxID=164546 RepID=A0A375FE70_9BURK|nr:protein of unknown function [Cupriavidus taiwanensis]SOZ72055.1 protein of unknown function [Cupriavidus taiwanensis]SOZ74378.1 protein of unknown function [Cupriavidus taiwanensis]SPA03283.1 protein of unknown function [Cupriavidus taiwanensis]SPA11261.1 protein of unknown function [Cupriavidus taiwanensis]
MLLGDMICPKHKISDRLLLSRRWRRAFAKYGTPEIDNTDQGSKFTATEFTDALNLGIMLSMDSKGSWRVNVLVEATEL